MTAWRGRTTCPNPRAVATSRADPGRWIVTVGVGALATLAYCVAGMRIYGFAGWGLGNTNHLLSACSPVAFGWLAYALARHLGG